MDQEIKVNPNQMCKKRVRATLGKLPKNFVEIIIHHFPEYNTIKGGVLLTNVKLGRTADMRLTEIFEQLANGELTLPVLK